jgi:acyl-homoserine lactone synthase
MIHVVTADNQHLYGPQLDQMFRMRHAFYIEGHGWEGLTGRDGRETDEFDDGDVVYLMSVDAWGEVAASVRLNPTTGPTLLKKFGDWSDEALPEGAWCWDISRWIAQPKHRRADNPRWPSNHQRELMVGILEFCLSRGISHLSMLAELRLAERIKSYGWPIRFLGAPRIYEGGKGTAVAAEIEVGLHILAITRQKTGVFGQVRIEIDPASTPARTPAKPAPSPALLAALGEVGRTNLHQLIRALAIDLQAASPDTHARGIELIGAFNQLLEAVGVDFETPHASAGAPVAPAPNETARPFGRAAG